jgi:hypothetical protein
MPALAGQAQARRRRLIRRIRGKNRRVDQRSAIRHDRTEAWPADDAALIRAT